jgi:hypothetical protein
LYLIYQSIGIIIVVVVGAPISAIRFRILC